MKTILQITKRFVRSEDGPTATEYAVLIAVICVAVIGALSSFGIHMDNLYTSLATTIPTGSGAGS
jgi:pilus assembly protein Flp/PilA